MTQGGVTGGEELARNFAKVGKELFSETEKAIEAACLFVEGEAKKKAPVDTGLLRNSISHRVRSLPLQVVGEVGSATEYAAYQEFGTGIYAKDGNGRKTPWFVALPNDDRFWTHGAEPKPFLTPAVNENKSKIVRIIEKFLKRKL